MNVMYPVYREPHDWVVLDFKTIHDFTDHPLTVVNVMIGTLHYYEKDIIGKNQERRTPITRWITRNAYHNYLKNEEL